MDKTKLVEYLNNVPDDIMRGLKFSVPWQYDSGEQGYKDADGFINKSAVTDGPLTNKSREDLQNECWLKFHKNPQINTTVRGITGRLTGWGFESTGELPEIQHEIELTEQDPRNRLYNFWPKFVARANIEGELFQCLSVGEDGFIEVDFIDPSCINWGGDDETGIIFHPFKTVMPLFYNIEMNGEKIQIPSIFVARYPDLVSVAEKSKDYSRAKQSLARSRKKTYEVFGGYNKFIVSWDKGFVTRRAVSYLRTVLEWINYYELLKKYEIDHKKSAGAYMWVFTIEDPKTFKLWLTLTDEERRKTGILAKKTAGGSLVLPGGMKVEAQSPNLPNISNQDSDILAMISSGMNESEGTMMGTSNKTFGSEKAGAAPMSDRTSDEVAYFERFLKYDFWGSVFFLKGAIGKFPKTFKVKEAVDFKEGKEVFKDVDRRPEELIDIAFPVSDTINLEGRARALLGVKHGPVAETLGMNGREVAKRMGIGGYVRMRCRKATEDKRFPKLEYNVDAETLQENVNSGNAGGKKPVDKSKEVKKPAKQEK